MPNLATLTAEGWSVPPIPSRRPIILAQSAVPASVTGTTVETVLASIVVPGGIMGQNGILRITAFWSYPNSANNKSCRIKLGGVQLNSVGNTTSVSLQTMVLIRNRGAANSQICIAGSGVGSSAIAPAVGAVDTTVDQVLAITGTLALDTETITLEGYTVEVLPG